MSNASVNSSQALFFVNRQHMITERNVYIPGHRVQYELSQVRWVNSLYGGHFLHTALSSEERRVRGKTIV